MADLPILFSAPMVRALLAGTKTQTRRVITPQNFKLRGHDFRFHRPDAELLASAFNGARDFRWIEGAFSWVADPGVMHPGAIIVDCRGKTLIAPGDRLWVREAWAVKRFEPCQEHERDWQSLSGPTVRYIADGAEIQHQGDRSTGRGIYHGPVESGRPSIHMPRWASRLTLYVTDVRVERLQDISESDARAEGFEPDEGLREVGIVPTARGTFSRYWTKLHGISLPRKPSEWAANPWVAAYTFAFRAGNIDALPATLEEAA